MLHKLLMLTVLLVSTVIPIRTTAQERLLLLNEGNWQADNGKLTYFENGKIISNQWFRDVNGIKLGDTPSDIIAVNDNLVAISVNWSNIVQFITPEGKAVAATEDIPNNRKLATDGEFVYVTSYGHECMVGNRMVDFKKGFVAKIDVTNFKVVAATEVGYEPEGIACYKGYLFVANTGGYAFQENHEYETTVSIVETSTMKVVRTVDTKQINLYGKMSQSGHYLCINSPGDYYEVPAATIILDCDAVLAGKPDKDCFVSLPYAATYNCVTPDGNFYAIGSRYSYYTGDYAFNYLIINPGKVLKGDTAGGISDKFPGTVLSDLKRLGMPYGIYVNPYTGHIYATDAAGFVEKGTLYQWSPEGKLLGKYGVYINPAHFLALKPDDYTGIEDITMTDSDSDSPIYNLHGVRIINPIPGRIYIRNGKKTVYQNY